jgi:biopolymer transport protein ExbD
METPEPSSSNDPSLHTALAAIAAGRGPASSPVVENTRRRKRRARHKPSIQVRALNITSFLDMSFALLTFLILGASFSPTEGSLKAKLAGGTGPGTAVLDKTPTIPLVLIVDQGVNPGSYMVSFQSMAGMTPTDDFEALTQKLKQLRYDPQTNPSGVIKPDGDVIIRPRADVVWQGVMQAFNAVERAKFSNVSIIEASR